MEMQPGCEPALSRGRQLHGLKWVYLLHVTCKWKNTSDKLIVQTQGYPKCSGLLFTCFFFPPAANKLFPAGYHTVLHSSVWVASYWWNQVTANHGNTLIITFIWFFTVLSGYVCIDILRSDVPFFLSLWLGMVQETQGQSRCASGTTMQTSPSHCHSRKTHSHQTHYHTSVYVYDTA